MSKPKIFVGTYENLRLNTLNETGTQKKFRACSIFLIPIGDDPVKKAEDPIVRSLSLVPEFSL